MTPGPAGPSRRNSLSPKPLTSCGCPPLLGAGAGPPVHPASSRSGQNGRAEVRAAGEQPGMVSAEGREAETMFGMCLFKASFPYQFRACLFSSCVYRTLCWVLLHPEGDSSASSLQEGARGLSMEHQPMGPVAGALPAPTAAHSLWRPQRPAIVTSDRASVLDVSLSSLEYLAGPPHLRWKSYCAGSIKPTSA